MTDDRQARWAATDRLMAYIDDPVHQRTDDVEEPFPPGDDNPAPAWDGDEHRDDERSYRHSAAQPPSPPVRQVTDTGRGEGWDEVPADDYHAGPPQGVDYADQAPDDHLREDRGDGYGDAYPNTPEAVGVGHPHLDDTDRSTGPVDVFDDGPAPEAGPVDLDDDDVTAGLDTDSDEDSAELGQNIQSLTPPARFSKPLVLGFVAVVGVVAIGGAAAMIGMQSSSPSPEAVAPSGTVSVVAPPPAPPAAAPVADPAQDVPIPFQASSACPQAGSGSAQNVASEDPTRAWVCMRDSDGQVMTLDLGKPMKVTAIELTPGWVGTDASGADQWMSHRVVTRVQWILVNGADRTVVTQDTKNAHGPVPVAMPFNGPDQGVLASQIQMVILQTSRPPADNPTPTSGGPGPAGGGLLDGVLGAPVGGSASPDASPDPVFGSSDTTTDPVDNTVAISAIRVLGHPPL